MFMQAHKWFFGFPGGSAGKEPACNVVDLGLIPGLGQSLGGGNGYPLQYLGLENSMDSIVKQSCEWHSSTLFGTALLLIYIFLKEGCCIILGGRKKSTVNFSSY